MKRFMLGGLTLLFLTACTADKLAPQPTTPTDFSGQWLVNFSDSDAAPDLRQRSKRSAKTRLSPEFEARRNLAGSGLAFVVHDFQILRADKIAVEQNRDSMGIQYYPGVYRDISWGERQRGLWEVKAGWIDNELLIISTAKDLRVEEQISLASADRLRVDVRIKVDGEEMAFTRRFTRQP